MYLEDITYGNGTFVTVGSSRTILTADKSALTAKNRAGKILIQVKH